MGALVVNAACMTVSGAPGTGTVTLGAAVPSYLSFALAGCSAGGQYNYNIRDNVNREGGIGTYVGDGTFTRDVVEFSTNGGAKINASSQSVIFIPVLASDINMPTQIATGQVSVGATATLIVAARTGRKSVSIQQLGDTQVWVGKSDVTPSTGILLVSVPGAVVSLDGSAAVYGITDAGSQTVSYIESY